MSTQPTEYREALVKKVKAYMLITGIPLKNAADYSHALSYTVKALPDVTETARHSVASKLWREQIRKI